MILNNACILITRRKTRSDYVNKTAEKLLPPSFLRLETLVLVLGASTLALLALSFTAVLLAALSMPVIRVPVGCRLVACVLALEFVVVLVQPSFGLSARAFVVFVDVQVVVWLLQDKNVSI